MHPLQNGSQSTEKPPTNNPIGDAGYFTESGTDGRPSYPGADYFNAQIDEFKTLLAAGNVEFDRTKFNHILMAIKAVCRGISQFAEYNPERVYFTGEVCFTKTGNEVTYWQWYSNQEWIPGKDPLENSNRHLGWADTTKPFYWVPYVSNMEGMPFYWLDTSAPEWAVMEINVDLPIAVYWRLARRYPHLVSGDTINTGEIRSEFLRVLDQGRGMDAGRVIGSHQSDDFEAHYHPLTAVSGGGATSPTFSSAFASPYYAGHTARYNDGSFANAGTQTYGAAEQGIYQSPETQKSSGNGIETRPRNIARSMAIVI
ncbi:hypothetical protein RJD40_20735 [Vibrio scophthalmi]|uniref:hypothetical protein n=1 Tax=Vibrio scophthalmi TaxID=45658 RepID=UPI003AB0B76F